MVDYTSRLIQCAFLDPSRSKNTMETTKPRILVVDDEDDIVYLLKKGLEQRGFSVDAYTDPFLALANYKPSEYSLCLLTSKCQN